jgi:hypothetical protein
MSEKNRERDDPAPSPGAVAKTAIRAIDACMGVLQRLRGRFEPQSDGDGKHRQPEPTPVPETTEAAPQRPSLLHRALVVLLCLLIGAGAGAVISYRGLAIKLKEHAGVVERMQDEIDAAKKAESRNVKLMDRFQRENAEYRQQTREAERQAEEQKSRADQLDAQLAEKKRAEQPPPPAARTAIAHPKAKPSTPPKTGDCTVGNGSDLTKCIDKFNR